MPRPLGSERTERFSTAVVTSFTVPIDVNMLNIYNEGATNAVKVSFEDDDEGDFRTLKPGKEITLSVFGGRAIDFDDGGSATDIELVMWSE